MNTKDHIFRVNKEKYKIWKNIEEAQEYFIRSEFNVFIFGILDFEHAYNTLVQQTELKSLDL